MKSSDLMPTSAAPTSPDADGKVSKRSRTVRKRIWPMALSVDVDRSALDDHRTERLDGDGGSLDGNAGLLEQDLAGADLELNADIGCNGDGLLDVDGLILRDLYVLASVLDVQLVVAVFQGGLAGGSAAEGFADGAGFRMADHQLIVLFGMQSDLFRALF